MYIFGREIECQVRFCRLVNFRVVRKSYYYKGGLLRINNEQTCVVAVL